MSSIPPEKLADKLTRQRHFLLISCEIKYIQYVAVLINSVISNGYKLSVAVVLINLKINSQKITKRMNDIAFRAHCNPNAFGMIYEQRNTNKILVAGFKCLEQALGGIKFQIESSINGLDNSIVTMSSSLNSIHS